MKKYEDGNCVDDEKDIEKFTVHFSDGSQKEFDKGFFCEIKEENGEDTLVFHMAHCSNHELNLIILGCAQLGVQLGYFN